MDSEHIDAAVRALAAGSRAFLAGFSACLAAALIAYGMAIAEAVRVPGIGVSVPARMGAGFLTLFALAMGWHGIAQFTHAASLLRRAEFVGKVPPQRIRLASFYADVYFRQRLPFGWVGLITMILRIRTPALPAEFGEVFQEFLYRMVRKRGFLRLILQVLFWSRERLATTGKQEWEEFLQADVERAQLFERLRTESDKQA